MSKAESCSDTSARRDEPMFATGSHVLGWVLIEVRGAWGEDAIHDSAFGEYVPATWKNELKRRSIRAVCIRSHLRADASDVRLFACTARRPGSGRTALWQRDVASLADVVPTVERLRIDRRPEEGWQRVDQSMVLVCTNGRHDQCCANLGRPLVRALRESQWAERVWECSHIGGDRFAPNMVVLPESLYFGRVDPDAARELLSALDEGRIDIARFRGRTSFSLAEQAVEHFVRRELDVDATDGVMINGRGSDGAFEVQLHDRLIRVQIQRRLVSVPEPLTCKGRANQLVPAFTLDSIT